MSSHYANASWGPCSTPFWIYWNSAKAPDFFVLLLFFVFCFFYFLQCLYNISISPSVHKSICQCIEKSLMRWPFLRRDMAELQALVLCNIHAHTCSVSFLFLFLFLSFLFLQTIGVTKYKIAVLFLLFLFVHGLSATPFLLFFFFPAFFQPPSPRSNLHITVFFDRCRCFSVTLVNVCHYLALDSQSLYKSSARRPSSVDGRLTKPWIVLHRLLLLNSNIFLFIWIEKQNKKLCFKRQKFEMTTVIKRRRERERL